MVRYYTSFFVWLVLFICVSAMLYSTSNEVTLLKSRISKLNKEIAMEQTSLHVLKAEWAYLTNPIRIEKQAKKRLNMSVIAANKIASMDELNKTAYVERRADTVNFVDRKPIEKPANKVYAATENKPYGLDKFNQGRINDRVRFETSIAKREAVIGNISIQ
ncbi:MAG: cell division protein FtsL [Alphaproteobacteria bacterium]|nr:cell division protein FtsL [Alphaproteobacteria bacterium]MCL2505543.1 cell division protein FtsL [Alphaproteobacteria bacterium]